MIRRSSMAFVGIAAACTLNGAAWAGDGPYRVGTIEVSGTPADKPNPFAWLGTNKDATLAELVGALEKTAGRSDLDAVLLRMKDAAITLSQVDEIGAAIRQVRDSGKRVHVYAEAYGPGELMLASYADDVILQDGSGVSLPGIYIEEMFLADTLAWLGIKADLVQVGDFKGANEQYTRTEPSKAWDENITQLLDSLYEAQRRTIMAGRGMSGDRFDTVMESAWMAMGPEAKDLGLVDTVLDLPALEAHLGAAAGGKVAWREVPVGPRTAKVNMNDPFAFMTIFRTLMEPPAHKPKGTTIAVVHIDGVIVDGDSSPGGLFGGESVGSRTIRNALDEIESEKRIKGVVVRINSPGGSAVASEVMWQGLRRLAAVKPVWVSVGSMAASGGYYVLVAGDRVYVNPSSIVGSIGVVGGKFTMGGLYDKLKVRIVGRGRGPMAEMMSSTTPWDARQVDLIRGEMAEIYDLFAKRVAQGREGIDLARTAEGRLFTGDRAVELQMADRVGGLSDAIRDMADELGLANYEVMHYPGPKGFDELIEQMFGGFARAQGAAGQPAGELAGLVAVLREAVGPKAWPAVRDAINGMMLLREDPIVLTMPRALIFR